MASSGEEVCAFVWRERLEQGANPVPQGIDAALGGFAQERLEFREGFLDWIEVGAVGRQVKQLARAASIALRTPAPLWLLRLSITMTSPGSSVRTRTWSTSAWNQTPLIGTSRNIRSGRRGLDRRQRSWLSNGRRERWRITSRPVGRGRFFGPCSWSPRSRR